MSASSSLPPRGRTPGSPWKPPICWVLAIQCRLISWRKIRDSQEVSLGLRHQKRCMTKAEWYNAPALRTSWIEICKARWWTRRCTSCSSRTRSKSRYAWSTSCSRVSESRFLWDGGRLLRGTRMISARSGMLRMLVLWSSTTQRKWTLTSTATSAALTPTTPNRDAREPTTSPRNACTSWRRKCGILSSNSRRKLPKIRLVRRRPTFLDLPQRTPCSQWVTWKIWMQIAKWAASKTKCSKWAWSTESYGSKSALLIVEKEVLALFLVLCWSSYISLNQLILIW